MSRLVVLMAHYVLTEGPLIFCFFVFFAIPRNMELFDDASTNAHGQTVMKRIQTTKKGSSLYCAFNARCFIAHSVWTDQRALNARSVHSVDRPNVKFLIGLDCPLGSCSFKIKSSNSGPIWEQQLKASFHNHY